jgi:hypothetical protein
MLIVWAVLAAIVFWLPFRRVSGSEGRERFHVALYCAVALLVAALAMVGFVLFVGMPTVSWYYIPFLGLVGVAIESALAPVLQGRLASRIRLYVVVAIIGLSLGPVWEAAQTRRTNMDMAAEAVAAEAAAKDFVLVAPFHHGISFDYHYEGKAPWCYIPVVPEKKRDLYFITIKEQMASETPLDMTLTKIEEVLKAGGRIWCLTGFLFLNDGEEPSILSPAPHPRHGWDAAPYRFLWELKVGHFLRKHAADIQTQVIDPQQPVNKMEKTILIRASNWRE